MKIPQCSRVSSVFPEQGSLGIRRAGAGGHLVMETCGKKLVLPLSPPRAGRRPQGGHAPPFLPPPQGPDNRWVSGQRCPKRKSPLKLHSRYFFLIPLRIPSHIHRPVEVVLVVLVIGKVI